MATFIHIGICKTGSTSIQGFLDANRALLQEHGYFYLSPIPHRSWDQERLAAQFKVLRSYLRVNSVSHVIISSEYLQSTWHGPDEIGLLKTFLERLGLTQFWIIVYLREPGEHFASMCTQNVKAGSLSDLSDLPLPQDNYWERLYCGYAAFLQDWGQIFGEDRLLVRRFSAEGLYDGDLFRDFVNALGMQWDDSFSVPPHLNEALNLLQMELLSRLNALSMNEAARSMLLRRLLKYLACPDDQDLCYAPPPEIQGAYSAFFAEDCEWVRRHFFPHATQLFAAEGPHSTRGKSTLQHLKPCHWQALAALLADLARENEALRKALAQARRHNL